VGELTLVASDTALMAVHFPTAPHGSGGEVHDVDSGAGVLARARQQLEEYFARTRTTFDLPLEPAGSAFQRRVWDALRAIPYGTTVSYSEIARRMGDVRATRAVGAANGQNPIPIIVPCHRVVGAHGELTGFGGGIDRKRWLLEHEGALLALGG
jgi:methylated-DNA-[protein]-cysteine S-methyltransferase